MIKAENFLKNLVIFITIFLNVTGVFYFASKIFSLTQKCEKADWIFEAIKKTPLQNSLSSVSNSFRPIKTLEGQDQEIILEFLKVDVNHASLEELDSLPRIGPKIAQRIIEERQVHGSFASLKDLERVKGIGSKTIEKLKDRVRFNPFELKKTADKA